MDTKSLIARLVSHGLTENTIRDFILPDWWCDEYEQEVGAVYDAAGYVARCTNLPFSLLIDPNSDLPDVACCPLQIK